MNEHSNDLVNFLVGWGVKEHCVDDEPIPKLRDMFQEYNVFGKPR